MNTDDHDTPTPLLPVVSDDESDGYYVGSCQVSEGEPQG